MKLCKIGIHKWGSPKQWIDSNGNVVFTPRCKDCHKLKEVAGVNKETKKLM
jgi:hypothetical protein